MVNNEIHMDTEESYNQVNVYVQIEAKQSTRRGGGWFGIRGRPKQ